MVEKKAEDKSSYHYDANIVVAMITKRAHPDQSRNKVYIALGKCIRQSANLPVYKKFCQHDP